MEISSSTNRVTRVWLSGGAGQSFLYTFSSGTPSFDFSQDLEASRLAFEAVESPGFVQDAADPVSFFLEQGNVYQTPCTENAARLYLALLSLFAEPEQGVGYFPNYFHRLENLSDVPVLFQLLQDGGCFQ